MIDTVSGAEALPFALQLKTFLEQEVRSQPKMCGLRVLESAHDNGMRMTAKMRDFEVKDLLSLTCFFGFSAETLSLAVNLLDRFLSVMKVRNLGWTYKVFVQTSKQYRDILCDVI